MLSPGGKWSGLTETLHFQKMRCWDDFSQYLLKPQAEAFFSPDGCIKWTCCGGAGFMLSHLHLRAGGGEAQLAACTACWRQMVTAAGRHHADQRLSPVHLLTQASTYSFLLGKALVAVQVLESCAADLFCLQPTVKETGKQARLFRALPVLSEGGFNVIHMCPQF